MTTASPEESVRTGAGIAKVSLDSLFKNLGRWHLPIFLFGFCRGSPLMLSMMFVVFAAPVRQKYWCSDPAFNSSDTCVSCQKYSFDREVYGYTIMEQFNLVCDRSWLASLAQSVYLFGLMVGGVIHAHISDRWGRRLCTIISLICTITTTIVTAFAPTVYLFITCRLITAFSISGFAEAPFTLAVESVHSTMRYMPTLIMGTGVSTGLIVLASVSYFVRDWVYVQFVNAGAMILLVGIWFLLPESPRWQLSTEHFKEAEKNLNRLVKHKKQFDESHVRAIVEESIKTTGGSKTVWPTMWTVFRRYPLATSVFCFCQAVSSMVWYYLTVSTTTVFGGSPYLAFIVAALTEFPSKLVNSVLIKFVTRKRTLFISFMLSSVVLLAAVSLPPEYSWIKLFLVAIGRLSCSMSTSVSRVAVTENYPTLLRAIALSIVTMTGRVGTCIAPFLDKLEQVWSSLPFMVVSALCFVAALMTRLLTETYGNALPETFAKEIPPSNDV